MKRKTWRLDFDNYQGEDFYYDFDNESAARTTFENVCNAYKHYDEFSRTDNVVNWFNAEYNSYGTRVRILEYDIFDNIFSEPIPVDKL